MIPVEGIERRIYFVRGHKVMLDSDLAELYRVTTFNLNKAVKRNRDRFPPDFLIRLSKSEWDNLRFQIGISSLPAWGGRRYPPFAFTEQGVAMLSGVLNSKKAVHVNVAIMRAFVRIQQLLSSNKDLARRIEELEKRHIKHDEDFKVVFAAISELMEPKAKPRPQIGFKPHKE